MEKDNLQKSSNKILNLIIGILAIIVGLGVLLAPLGMGSMLNIEPFMGLIFFMVGFIILIGGIVFIFFGINKSPK